MSGFIRTATSEDAPAIAQVHVASWRDTYPGVIPQAYLDSLDEQEFAARWRERLEAEPETQPSMSILVAERDGRLCGFAAGGALRKPLAGFADGGELYALYLPPDAQRQGLGRALFAAIAAELVRQQRIGLVVWVLYENRAAIGFYERLGGSPAGEEMIEIGGESLRSVAYGWRPMARSMETGR